MGLVSHKLDIFSDGSILDEPPITETIHLFQYGDDYQVFGEVRDCAVAGCPAVMVLQDKPDTVFDQQWQYFLYAINKGMTLGAIAACLGDTKALTNAREDKANYISGMNLDKAPPNLDKLRTFALNTHAGRVEGNMLRVTTLDGNNPPPLNPGWSYPRSLEEVDLRAYKYIPQNHRYLFLDCTNIKSQSGGGYKIGPWANGLERAWIGDGRPHTFFPLVSRYPILTPLSHWRAVTSFPSPFK